MEDNTLNNKTPSVPYRGTPEQEDALKVAIAQLKDLPGSLMPILQKAQEIFGYLPEKAKSLFLELYSKDIPLKDIYRNIKIMYPWGRRRSLLRRFHYYETNHQFLI